jgi:glycosyltransferase involved in cell wall biosynthesis
MRRTAGAMSPDISVVLCTWNRAALLDDALRALTTQEDAPPHEIIVVDNASTDGTADVAQRYALRCPHLRYVFEARPGLSFARNTGIASSTGRIVAFTDDDVRVGPGWVRTIAAAFARDAQAGCAGGPVLPAWEAAVPAWLTERHWAPLGIQDYGDAPLRVDASRPICLIGANLSFRRDVLDAIGGFDPTLQRVGNGAGSTEDHECHIRLWQAGFHGIYDPALRVQAIVPAARLSKRHHRAWHYGHGRHIARMRIREIEASGWRFFGAPGHIIRQAFADFGEWLTGIIRGDGSRAFEREIRLWFAAGFLRERWG